MERNAQRDNDRRWRVVDSIMDGLALLLDIEEKRTVIHEHAQFADPTHTAVSLDQIHAEAVAMQRDIAALKQNMRQYLQIVVDDIYMSSTDDQELYRLTVADEIQEYRIPTSTGRWRSQRARRLATGGQNK